MGNTTLDTIRQMLRISPQAQFLLEGDSVIAASPEAQRFLPGMRGEITAARLFGDDIQQYHQFQQEGSMLFNAQIAGRRCDVTVTALPPYCLCTIAPAAGVEHAETMCAVAQQLRNPLSSIMSVTPKLLPMLEELEDPEAMRRAAALNQGLYQMLRLAENLERYAMAQPAAQLCRFDLRVYFQELEDQLAPLCRKAGRTLEFHYPSEVCLCTADKNQLTQAIMNLLSNAIKFSRSEQTIVIGCRKQKGRVLISIRDQGQGIPPDQMGTVFLHSEHRGQLPDPRWGAGLGLQTARRIIEAHGGRLMLETVEGQGTTVYLSLEDQSGGQTNTLCDTIVPVANGIDPVLVGLADVLPAQVYDVLDTCL